mmetsp:Transcript_115921/g.322790  ORF Transcript_115921/g.322790 Transcript_115921/m.322790 type:complete len:95 (+) Transcript_115921:1289-1573(+)
MSSKVRAVKWSALPCPGLGTAKVERPAPGSIAKGAPLALDGTPLDALPAPVARHGSLLLPSLHLPAPHDLANGTRKPDNRQPMQDADGSRPPTK